MDPASVYMPLEHESSVWISASALEVSPGEKSQGD